MKTAVYLLFALSFLQQACSFLPTSDEDSTKKDIAVCNIPAKKVDIESLERNGNSEVMKLLSFPTTIIYIGLDKPATSVSNGSLNDIPNEMVLIPAGNVQIGSEEGMQQENPVFWASLKPFLMDKQLVTVAQFRVFVKATNYQTQAEKFGDAGLIDKSTNQQWILKKGANWEYPMGKDFPKAEENHPVTQVSWNDANAYAKWVGKRLPCEIEWEHAARNARNSRTKYPWGEEIQSNGKWNANVWQGKFPLKNFVEDKFAYTSPVGSFGKTSLGLTDMSGNVWQWMTNRKFNYAALFKKTGYEADISEEYAERGGSFLCEPTWCHGYRVSGRSSSSSETSLFHLGFRCVKDL
jgi:formylglycine-generating enzyme